MPNFDYTITGGGFKCQALKTSDAPTPKIGYGGHPIGARPKRKALTVYAGRQPFSLEIPMLMWRDGGSVEQDRIALDNMATSEGEFDATGQPEEPPTVHISASFPLPVPPALGQVDAIQWWIEDIDWKEEFRRPPAEGGYLTYKLVTVTLLEATTDVLLEKGARGVGSRRGKYTVRKPPDTLKRIASKFHTSVAVIKALNPKLRSDGSLKNGMKISVPEPATTITKPSPKAPGRKGKGRSKGKAKVRKH